jgi:hypothetical protein
VCGAAVAQIQRYELTYREELSSLNSCGGIGSGDDGVAFDYAVGRSGLGKSLVRLPVKRRAMVRCFSTLELPLEVRIF